MAPAGKKGFKESLLAGSDGSSKKEPQPSADVMAASSATAAATASTHAATAVTAASGGLDVPTPKAIQLDALVVMKIVKHCQESWPTIVTGQLLGLDNDAGTLEVTNCFPFPGKTAGNENGDVMDGAEYQMEMMRCLREVNVDHNTVGWYQSTYLGSFINPSMIETQFNYQQNIAQSVVLVYDPNRSSYGGLCLRAFRLTDAFMTTYGGKKLTLRTFLDKGIHSRQILEELPIHVHNSHLVTALMHDLTTPTTTDTPTTSAMTDATDASSSNKISLDSLLVPSSSGRLVTTTTSLDALDKPMDTYLERNMEAMMEAMEANSTHQNRFYGYQRMYMRQQQHIAALKARTKQETGQEATEEEIAASLHTTLHEPSRYENLLTTTQLATYCEQVEGFAAAGLSKYYFMHHMMQKTAP